MKKTFFNWSTGKDAALALYRLMERSNYDVQLLLTNINRDFDRVSMHGLRNALLDKQVESIGIPLDKVEFPKDVSMALYDQKMNDKFSCLKKQGFEYAAYGDIFLEDLKTYRDQKLSESNLSGIYPLWKENSLTLLQEFLNAGFKAITVCVNAKLLGNEFVGRVIDQDFINKLPKGVDPCGENGEFHTFVFDGPIFTKPVSFTIGEKTLRSYTLSQREEDNCHQHQEKQEVYDTSFWYCDLIPN